MILRHIARQQGRAFLRVSAPTRACRRFYASEIDSTRPGQSSPDQSQLEKQALEALIQASQPQNALLAHGSEMDAEVAKAVHKHQMLEHQTETMGRYGAVVPKHYSPSDLITNPPQPHKLSPELLLASQTHLGHATALWNPMNSQYIYGVRDGIHIIALEETLAHLRRACRVVEGVAERGGFVLFVGTRRGQEQAVVRAAQLAGGYHLFERWIPGSITNSNQVLGGARKKLVDRHDNEISVGEESLKDIPAIKPDLVVCLNPLENWVLLNECAVESIPTIGIIDTDADPTWVTYPIPANDDSLRATTLIVGALGRAGQAGQTTRKEAAAEGRLTYEPPKLPQDFAWSDEYMSTFIEKDVPVEYIDSDGSVMSQEQIDQLHREGMIVDDSLMHIYHDGDGGNLSATSVHSFTEDGLVRVLTPQGGAALVPDPDLDSGSGSDSGLGSALSSSTEADDFSSTGIADPSSAIDAALSRFESIKQASTDLSDEHSAFRLDKIEQEITALRGEFMNLNTTPEERLEREGDALAEMEAHTVDLDASPIAEENVRNDADEQLAMMDENERIEAAKPKPDDKRQAKLDEENRKRSH